MMIRLFFPLAASASIVAAQAGPVVYSKTSQTADLSASVTDTAPGGGPGDSFDDSDESTLTLPGSLQGSLNASAASQGTASVEYELFSGVVDDSAMESRGQISVAVNRGTGQNANAGGGYLLFANFTSTEATQASISGKIDIGRVSGGAGASATSQAFITVTVFGITPGPLPDFVSYSFSLGLDPSPNSELDFFETFPVAPGGTYGFSITAANNASVDTDTDPTEELTISWTCSLVVGDRDEDGLLDRWETDGIDTDGDGIPEINLPAMGANPDRKDLFLEIDTHQGSSLPTSVINAVRDAFAAAPVDNPVGPDGITLHAIIDEQSLPPRFYSASTAAEVAAQKALYYGSVQDRASDRWETEIRPARLRVFRYCVWGGSQIDGSSGWGEIPGDDLIVTLESPNFNNITNQDRAGTLMHEIGHTLGLRHGGGDDVGHKPNYLSVMNYSFQFRSPFGSDDTVWRLDFSRDQFPTLDESALEETNGFNAPPGYIGRMTVYNVATSGPPLIDSDLVEAGSVDFNNDNDQSGVVAVDLNRQRSSQPPSPGDLLVGHDDWANIVLRLAGSANFGSGVSAGLTTSDLSPELTGEDYQELRVVYANVGGTPCPPDLADPIGTLNFFDLAAYLALYNAGDPAADLAPPSGVLNFFDLAAYLNLYNVGCP
jgi:hypothetical protein